MRLSNLVFSALVALSATSAIAGTFDDVTEQNSLAQIPRDENVPLLSWSDFHSLKESDRKKALETIRDLMKDAEGKKIVSGGRRFCVFGGNVREVPEKKKCEIPFEGCASNQVQCNADWSSKLCAVREKDGGARSCYEKLPNLLESSVVGMDLWLQLRRLSFAFCSDSPTRICDELKKLRVRSTREKQATSSFSSPMRKRSMLSWLEKLLPTAEAKDKYCNYDNDSILFPNGDRIFFDYGHHTSKYQMGCIENLFANPSLATAEFRTRADECRSTGSTYTKDINARGDRVQKIIEGNEIQWLGIEMSRFESGRTDELDEEVMAERARSYRDLSKNHGYTDTEADEIASMKPGIGGVWQALWKNEGLGEKYNLTPLEGDEEKQAASKEFEVYSGGFEKLMNLKADKKVSQQEIDSILKAENKSILNYKPLSSSEISALTGKVKDSKAKEAAAEFLKGASGIVNTNRDRDLAVVRNARLKGGSGIISFGAAHKNSMNEKFLRACREELNHAPGTGVKSSDSKSRRNGGGSSGEGGVQ